MCPLVSAPARGYADYQRLENFDSGILLNASTPLSNVAYSSPIMDVSRFAYLCGFMGCGTANVAVSLNYSIDALGSTFVGDKNFQMTFQGFPAGIAHIINLGPFVQILVQGIAGASFTFSAKLFASNRVALTEFIAFKPQLISVQNQTEPAGTADYYPNAMFVGPMKVLAFVPVSGTSTQLQILDNGNIWEIADDFITTTANQLVSVDMVAPLGAWRIEQNNPGAATAGMYLSVTPSVTGAS